MGLYSRWLFPILCDRVMRQPRLGRLRRELLSGVRGEVLEIGFGTGLNLPYYPGEVTRITAVDPNPGMRRLAGKRVEGSFIPVEFLPLGAERLSLADGAFDSVVSTWTLCSIPQVDQALGEIRRVLKPGGRFFFLEHGRSDAPNVQKWQDRLTPLNRKLADGCHLNRAIEALIQGSGLKVISLKRFYLEKAPKVAGYFYQGAAEKEGER